MPDGGVKKSMQLWGVINLTPDSFYVGSRFAGSAAVNQTETFLRDGAAMVDVGAESTRPGAQTIPAEEQIAHLGNYLDGVVAVLGSEVLRRISVDTRDLAVMQYVLERGVTCINDVSGGNDAIYQLIAGSGAEYVLMHTQGSPAEMQRNPQYGDVIAEIKNYLEARSQRLLAAGVHGGKIIWDPGIGFGKTVEHNLALLANSPVFQKPPYRLLLGVSRKSFIGKILGADDPAERLSGTLAVQVYLTLRGCDILRLHDVKEMADCLKIVEALKAHVIESALSSPKDVSKREL